MHTFEKGDKRKETLIYEYTNANGQLHNETEDRKATSNLLYYGAPPCKYDYLDFAGTLGQNSETDYIIYRYADVLTYMQKHCKKWQRNHRGGFRLSESG